MQKVRIEKVSDISNETIKEGEGETVRFSLDGGKNILEIDLSTKEASAFHKALDPYVSAARKASNGGGASRSSASRNTSDKERLTRIREWAASQGIKVNTRGRISSEVLEAYDKENPSK